MLKALYGDDVSSGQQSHGREGAAADHLEVAAELCPPCSAWVVLRVCPLSLAGGGDMSTGGQPSDGREGAVRRAEARGARPAHRVPGEIPGRLAVSEAGDVAVACGGGRQSWSERHAVAWLHVCKRIGGCAAAEGSRWCSLDV